MCRTSAVCVMFVVLGLFELPGAAKCADLREVRRFGTGTPAKVNGVQSRGLVFEDPFTGATWRVESDPRFPGGPGKLVRIILGLRSDGPTALIRAGETVRILQDTSNLQADLEAIALSSGALGDSVKVRLQFGGRVVVARITSAGRAVLLANGTQVHP